MADRWGRVLPDLGSIGLKDVLLNSPDQMINLAR